MIQIKTRKAKFVNAGIALFCLMCLFFAINMASRYEYQRTETEIYRNKVKELEEEIRELSKTNKELLQMRHVLALEKEQMAKEINTLHEKYSGMDEWKLTIKKDAGAKEASPGSQSESISVNR